MQINFGKHNGKSVEEVMLKFPDYVAWIKETASTTGAMTAVKNEIARLTKAFDAKPFSSKCDSCSSTATRFSLYRGNSSVMCWCDECSPYSAGANEGKLSTVARYEQLLGHAKVSCGGRAADYRDIVKEAARAKGLPKRVTAAEALRFFQ